MFLKTWKDWLFPPLCACCKERCEDSFFCPTCWISCAPTDPEERCPHCFEESDKMCRQCKIAPRLAYSRAAIFRDEPPARLLARQRPDLLCAFAVHQWALLDWEAPDVVIPMKGSRALAQSFSQQIGCPYAPILRGGKCDAGAIEEDQILLLVDRGGDMASAKKNIDILLEAFPKKGYLLSLFPYDFTDP